MSTSGPPTPHAQSSDDAAPTGWGVAAPAASTSAAPADSHYSSRVGNRKLRSLPEVQRHLKHDVGEANCNADELLWLQTLERYGTSFAKHWAVAKAVPELEECPTFRPTLEEWSEPGRYVESIMPQITAHGMCKVVPPAGWRPQPWSGRPPKGATDRERSEVVGSVEEVCRALGGRDREGSVTCELNPRVQPMQLFNKSFEQIDKLSLERYRELAEKAWPTEAFAGSGAAAAPTLAEAEVAFWSQMVSNVPQNGANGAVPVGLDAGKVRAEAEVYQRRVQEAQATGGKSREGSLSARVLVQIPWELQGAPPVMSRPASAPRPDPRPPPAAPVPRPFPGGLSRPPAAAPAPQRGTAPYRPPAANGNGARPPAAAAPLPRVAPAPQPTISNGSSVATPPVPPPEFALGQRVRVKGLSQRAELNGLAGVVLAYDGAKERYTVQLSGRPKAMAMRKQHLETDDAPVEGVVVGVEPPVPTPTSTSSNGSSVATAPASAPPPPSDGAPPPSAPPSPPSDDAASGGGGGGPDGGSGGGGGSMDTTESDALLAAALQEEFDRSAARVNYASLDRPAPAAGPTNRNLSAAVDGGSAAIPPPVYNSADCAACTRGAHKAHTCGRGNGGRGRGSVPGRGGGRGGGGRGGGGGGGARKRARDDEGEEEDGSQSGDEEEGMQRSSRGVKRDYRLLADEEERGGYDSGWVAGSMAEEDQRHEQRQRFVERLQPQPTRQEAAEAAEARQAIKRLASKDSSLVSALYAADLIFDGPDPMIDTAKGEVAPTVTRSGLMDSLLRCSLLRFSPLIPGVNYPMVYVGTRNTFFCWHVEDNHLYATNYVHQGAPKVWYAVPPGHMEAMETVWTHTFKGLVGRHPDLFYWKTHIWSPAVLLAHGVPVYRATHEAGSFIFTSPGAYHAGFNTGWNVAESTNFAFADWLPVGARAVQRYASPPVRDTTLLHDALVCTAAQHAQTRELPAILAELRQMRETEANHLTALQRSGVKGADDAQPTKKADGTWAHPWDNGADDSSHTLQWRCRVCRRLCYFSTVKCGCVNDHFLCHEHALHTQADADGYNLGAYIHKDYDPEGARRQAEAARSAKSSSSYVPQGNTLVPPPRPPADGYARPKGKAPCNAAGVSYEWSTQQGVWLEPPAAAAAASAIPPPFSSGACTLATGAAAAPAPPAAAPAAPAPQPPPAGAPPPTPPPSPPPANGAAAAASKEPAAGHVWVRFACSGCNKKLKAQVPVGARRISTTCASCKQPIMAVISQGDGSQQAGRARHRAGAGVGDDRPGQLHDAGCRCAASQRRLLCHYPLAQLDELIAAVATKCEAV